MSGALRGVVVTHGRVAEALIAAAEEITGIKEILVPVTNSGAGREALEERVLAAVGSTPAVVFVDMPSGSCLIAAMRRVAGREDVRVVTGVNLAMLLDFLMHRDRSVAEAARHAAATGTKSILER